jgi:glucosamine-6-phosphate deaminase
MPSSDVSSERLRFIANGAPSADPVHFELERIPTYVFEQSAEASRTAAHDIGTLIEERQAAGEMAVLGLATGSTPTAVYAELIRMHREEGLSFANVVSFNLDEYWPMEPDSLQSYRRFMNEHLFDHIDIDPANIYVPDGTIAPEEVRTYCEAYEQTIAQAGGIDIQLLGIGRTGHIGFNEPGSGRTSLTRVISLVKRMFQRAQLQWVLGASSLRSASFCLPLAKESRTWCGLQSKEM